MTAQVWFAQLWLAAVSGSFGSPAPPPSAELVSTVERLREGLRSPDQAVRGQAEAALLILGPEAVEPLLVDLVRAKDPSEREVLHALLPKFGPRALPRLMWAPYRGNLNRDDAREAAVEIAARMGAQALPFVHELLDHGGDGFTGFGVGILRNMGPAATDELIRFLKHPKPEVRSQVATLMANFPDPRAADAFLEGLSSTDLSVRAESARALGNLRDHRAIPALLGMLHHENIAVRESAGAALAKLYEPRSLGPLGDFVRWELRAGVRETTTACLIKFANDPIAMRIGRRYRPISIDPIAQGFLRLRQVLRLSFHGLLMLVVLWLGVKLSRGRTTLGLPLMSWPSVLVLASLGFWWGRLATAMSGEAEVGLLLGCVPVVALLSFLLGYRRKPSTGISIFTPSRRATLLGTSSFYLGFGVGWYLLWGYMAPLL